jgi:eukaryotic translation initiation factor 2C
MFKAIAPLWEPKKSFNIGARKGIELVMRLQEDTYPNIFQPPGAYDGKKNLFSFHQFNFTAEEVDYLLTCALQSTDPNLVSCSLGSSQRSSTVPTAPQIRIREDRICASRQRGVSILKVVCCSTVDSSCHSVLRKLLSGRGTLESLQPEGDVATSLNMLNVFVQAAPRMSSHSLVCEGSPTF